MKEERFLILVPAKLEEKLTEQGRKVEEFEKYMQRVIKTGDQ